jgi:hypothetical protein
MIDSRNPLVSDAKGFFIVFLKDEDKDEQEDEPALCIHYPIIMLCFIDHTIHSTTKTIEHSFDCPNTNVFR